MKAAKSLFIISAICLMIIGANSCKKNDNEKPVPIDYSTKILGTWISENLVDSIDFTDDIFVIRYTSDGKEMYAKSYNDESGKRWNESNNLSYRLNGNLIITEGCNSFGVSTYIETIINYINDHCMNCTEKGMVDDTISIPDFQFIMNKVTIDYQEDVLGTWKGRYFFPTPSDTNFNYFTFYKDGRYDFRFLNGDGVWQLDSTGYYFVYGTLLSTNFTRYSQGETTPTYENWMISFQNGYMIWSAVRVDGIKNYVLQRVTEFPF